MKQTRALALLSLTLFWLGDAVAWGPHPTITQAALDRLPEMERWVQVLGAENIHALTKYCLMPDLRGSDRGEFYADDYLLIQQCPKHAGHTMPAVQETFVIYFRRALQALRTETPVNACRQIGSLIHFVEDAGAPPHAKEQCPHHKELENWVQAKQIVIPDYQPQLLGKTDSEAESGLLRRMAELVAFSKERAERALPLVSQTTPDQGQVEPIILESALESSRVTADVLYTVFKLGLAPQPPGGRIVGTIEAAEFPHNDKHGARVVLLDTDYATLTTGSRHGAYEFRNLPAGTYRVLAYRTASKFRISDPVTVQTGGEVCVDLVLPPTEPPGNIIENPDAKLSYLPGGAPDRWKPLPVWTSTAAIVAPKTTYRCGAEVKDESVEVSFVFQGPNGDPAKMVLPVTERLAFTGKSQAERTVTTDDKRATVLVQVHSKRPLADVIGRVWVIRNEP